MPHPRQSIGGEKSIAMDIDQTYRPAFARRRQRRPAIWNISDLLLIVDLAILLPILVLLPLSWLRVPLGLALVLFAPGYVLTEAIFPRRHEIGGVTRAALSFGLSAVTLPLLALVLSALPWGIRPWPMVLSLSLWVVLLCAIAIWRRWASVGSGAAGLPPRSLPNRGALWADGWRRWGGLSRRAKARSAIGALALGGALIAGAAALITAGSQAALTEFYVLGKQGLAEDYPRQATLNDELTVTLGIVNREGQERGYRIEIWAVDANKPDRRALVRQAGPMSLAPGQRLEQPVSWRMPWAGDDQMVELLMFMDDSPTPYRQLHLWLNVHE
jgi:uncharacterized membrane protein